MLDQITINKFIAGDVKAFERLFRKYARSMQLVALGLYRDTAVAEDAVQESFVYLWNHRKEMKPDIAIEGYLYSCVRHYVLNYIRHQNIRIRQEKATHIIQAKKNPNTVNLIFATTPARTPATTNVRLSIALCGYSFLK